MSKTIQAVPLPLALPCKVRHFPLKRIFDLLFSSTILIFFSPVFALIALTVRLSSKGKSIYSHPRIGRGGKPFTCCKFRTMYHDADERLENLLASDPKIRQEWEETRKLKKDPRITPIGAFLRKTSLDELPQFWNVVKGDLSVVGPRPVMQEEMTKYFGAKAAKILSIRPGLTGIWQVSGRNHTTYNERIQMDELYVDTRSFALDLMLIAKTLPNMIASEGAY